MAGTLNEALRDIAPDDGSGTPITVSSDLRTLTIPANVTMIGIVTDEKTNIIHFRVPRYSKTFDLSAFSISIIYKNALGNTYYHPVAQGEIALTEDFISFFWIPERAVYVAAGTVTIALDFKLYENGEVSREWNTTTGSLQVHDTLKDGAEEVVVEQPETIYSIVNEYLETLDISGGGSGSQGPKGDKGDKGDPGEDGEDGKSAYELAVDSGYTGTLAEWLLSLKGEKGDKGDTGDSSSPKTLITIIDDDGTTGTDDNHTGIKTFLHSKNIPLAYAVPCDVVGTSGKMTLAALQGLVADGDEVVLHGLSDQDNSKTCSLAEFKTMVDESVTWAKTNGFTDDVFVYPQGLQINSSTSVDEKLAYLRSKGIKMAYNVNTGVESSAMTGFEEWAEYENGSTYKGIYNVIPFVTMPNGYNKKLLINRAEINGTTNISLSWWKNKIDSLIGKDVYMCFFIHSYKSAFSTQDGNGKTATDYFKDTINYILENYGDKVQFVTPSKAHEIIEDMPVTTGMVENTVANYIEDHKDALKGDVGESGVERQITVSNAVTSYSIKPNILYVFPEESALTISFDETGIDTSVVNDYHFTFVNGSTACELELPESVNIGDLELQPNTVCEISIVNGLLSFQNWSTE